MMMKVDIGVMAAYKPRKAKDCQEAIETRKRQEEFSEQVSEEALTCNILRFWNFSLQNYEMINLFKPPICGGLLSSPREHI